MTQAPSENSGTQSARDFTPAQAEVIRITDRPVLVQAGPGSGKTLTLAEKFVRLVGTGIPAERILALTFSKKAAAEMRHRIEAATKRSYGRLWVSTFHSFGHAIVQRFLVEANMPRSFRLLTGFKEWVLARDVLRAAPISGALAAAREHRGLVVEVANTIGLLKHNRIDAAGLKLAAQGSQDEDLLLDLAKVYEVYEAELRRRRHFDYRDLINVALNLMETKEAVRREVQSWFDYILIDELQDIDRAQLLLIRSLVQGGPLATKATACGDAEQSIYRFRGAIPRESFPLFLAIFPNAATVELSKSFRALAPITAIGRRVLGKPLPEPEPTTTPVIEVRAAATSLAEASAIGRELRRLHGARRRKSPGTLRWRDMAVLCRSVRRDGKPIENELARLGIPYRVHGNASFYRNPAVAFLVNFILALVDEADDMPLRRVLASPVPTLPTLPLARFLDRVSHRGRHAGKYFWFLRHLMARENPERFPAFRPEKEDQAAAEKEVALEKNEFRDVKAPYFYELMSPEEKQAFYDFHKRFLYLRARARKAKDALPALVAAIAARSGLTDWILALDKTDPREAARHGANLTKLHSMVEDYVEIAAAGGAATPTLADLARHLRELLEHFANESEVDAPGDEFLEPEDAVSIMTVHQAKGLEFDAVFIPNLVTGRFPAAPRPGVVLTDSAVAALAHTHAAFADPNTPDPLLHAEEEKRLFYVAITRAKERLFFSWARRYDGDDDDSAPSPFLLEALGGTELAFWRRLQEEGLAHRVVVSDVVAASAWPEIRYIDDEEAVDRIEEATGKEELEIVLRRLYARGTASTRKTIQEALDGTTVLDSAFISAVEPFPREPQVPIRTDPQQIELSASRLTDYRDCPRKFFYSKLLHLELPSTNEARFGTAIHEALKEFHDAHPDRAEILGARDRLEMELRDRFEKAITAEQEGFQNDFAYRRAMAQARAMASPYLTLLREEPLRFVAGREVDIRFNTAGARFVAKIDRIGADANVIETAGEALISDYKTVRVTNPRAITLRDWIEDGREIQLVTYWRAFVERYGRSPRYLGKAFLRHTSDWRPGTLQVLLRVQAREPPKGDPWRGRDGRKMTDRAWIAPSILERAWVKIEGRVREILSPSLSHFRVTPKDDICKNCAYATICGKEEVADAADA